MERIGLACFFEVVANANAVVGEFSTKGVVTDEFISSRRLISFLVF